MSAPALGDLAAAPWLADRDPRLRLLAALAIALVVVGLTRPVALLTALGAALALALAAGLPWSVLLRRLIALEGLLLILVGTLPFAVQGQALWHWGPLVASREGLALALTILARASAMALTLVALVGTLEPVALGHALGRLGVPEPLVHLFLFTLRHVHALHDEYARLRLAMRARAFSPRSDRHTWNTLGWLMGMLLVRSLGRARRTLAAMRCRGFQGHFYLLDDLAWTVADTRLAVGLGLVPLALLALEHLA